MARRIFKFSKNEKNRTIFLENLEKDPWHLSHLKPCLSRSKLIFDDRQLLLQNRISVEKLRNPCDSSKRKRKNRTQPTYLPVRAVFGINPSTFHSSDRCPTSPDSIGGREKLGNAGVRFPTENKGKKTATVPAPACASKLLSPVLPCQAVSTERCETTDRLHQVIITPCAQRDKKFEAWCSHVLVIWETPQFGYWRFKWFISSAFKNLRTWLHHGRRIEIRNHYARNF